jgi:hypothetical protein
VEDPAEQNRRLVQVFVETRSTQLIFALAPMPIG